MNANRNADLLKCPTFLLELVAKRFGLPLSILESWIKSNDNAAIERIEAVILGLGDRVRNIQNERGISGEGGEL